VRFYKLFFRAFVSRLLIDALRFCNIANSRPSSRKSNALTTRLLSHLGSLVICRAGQAAVQLKSITPAFIGLFPRTT